MSINTKQFSIFFIYIILINSFFVQFIISAEFEKLLTTAISTPPTPLKGNDVTTSFVSKLTVEPVKKSSTGLSTKTPILESQTTTTGGNGNSQTTTTSDISNPLSPTTSTTTTTTGELVDPQNPINALTQKTTPPIPTEIPFLSSSTSTSSIPQNLPGTDDPKNALSSAGTIPINKLTSLPSTSIDSIANVGSIASSTTERRLTISDLTLTSGSNSGFESSNNRGGEYYLPQNLVCLGYLCPNGKCVLSSNMCSDQLNGIIQRCPNNNPVRCPDGSCNTSSALCPPSLEICSNSSMICPNGKCSSRACPQYDGCSVEIPFQCPNGICMRSVSGCDECEVGGHLKCFDGSCSSPCPYPPFYYKPINVRTSITQSQQSTLIPINSYSSPLDYNTGMQKVLDIIIPPNNFPLESIINIQGVSDSYISKISCDKYWPEDFQFQLFLLSSVINITAQSEIHDHPIKSITSFDKRIKFEFTLPRTTPDIENDEICLGFINEETKQWECIPERVEIIKDGGPTKIISYTNHFTSFALLTTYHSKNHNSLWGKSNDSKKCNMKLILGIALGSIVVAIMIISVGVIYHFSSKHGGLRNWLILTRSPKKGSTPINSPKMSDPDLLSSSSSSTTHIKLSSSTERPQTIF